MGKRYLTLCDILPYYAENEQKIAGSLKKKAGAIGGMDSVYQPYKSFNISLQQKLDYLEDA